MMIRWSRSGLFPFILEIVCKYDKAKTSNKYKLTAKAEDDVLVISSNDMDPSFRWLKYQDERVGDQAAKEK